MNPYKKQNFINQAEDHMRKCSDPIHDIDHVRRVVAYSIRIAQSLRLNKKELDILLICAWWHDVSRSKIKQASFVWLTLFDDIFSAIMLLRYSRKIGYLDTTVWVCVKILVCKTMSGGTLLTKIFLNDRERLLMYVIEDADNLDVMNVERMENAFVMVSQSRIYSWAYRVTVRWYIMSNQLCMKTQAAKKIVLDIIKKLIEWLKQEKILLWHIKTFGNKWVKNRLEAIEILQKKIKNEIIFFKDKKTCV